MNISEQQARNAITDIGLHLSGIGHSEAEIEHFAKTLHDYIDERESFLVELEAIEKRAEEILPKLLPMNSYGGRSVQDKINYIIKGEGK